MGKLQKTSEVKGKIEVGKFYLVPFATGVDISDTPILLPAHRDKDLFPSTHGASRMHYHRDIRFDPDWAYKETPVYGNEHYQTTNGFRYISRDTKPLKEDSNPGRFIEEVDVLEIVWKRRKARRQFPEFTKEIVDRNKRFHKPLQDIAIKEGYCLKAKKVCPHRGFNLDSIPPDENGLIECPMHGLRFYAESGKLVTQDFDEIERKEKLASLKRGK